MTVTFLTTEDAQAINTQLSNLVQAIAELNKQIDQSNKTLLYVEEKFTDGIQNLEQLIKYGVTKKSRKKCL